MTDKKDQGLTAEQPDWLAVYALGGLEPEERRAAEQLLAANPELRRILAGYEAAVNHLPMLPYPLTPPASLRDRLVNRIRTNAGARGQLRNPAADLSLDPSPEQTGWLT